MLNGHCFKIARQMYRSFCEQQNLHWRPCIGLTRMKKSTGMKTFFDDHACETAVEPGQVS